MDSHNRGHDIYKDTPIRLLGNFIESFRYSLVNLVCGTGYANEVGESLRGFIGAKWVNISYGIATLYVFADTIDKTAKTYHVKTWMNGTIEIIYFIILYYRETQASLVVSQRRFTSLLIRLFGKCWPQLLFQVL